MLDLTESELKVLGALLFWAKKIEVSDEIGSDAVVQLAEQFVAAGMPELELSSAFFNRVLYRCRIATLDLPTLAAGDEIGHWLRHGFEAGIVPTLAFDEEAYLQEHQDVRRAGKFGFEHFLLHGRTEGRAIWPAEPPADMPVESFDPQGLLAANYRVRGEDTVSNLVLVRAMFSPALYLAGIGSEQVTSADAFAHFVRGGMSAETDFSLAFDPLLYVARAKAAGLSATVRDSFCHWLAYGLEARIVPTALFDEAYYVAANYEVGRSGVFGFVHWLLFGRRQRRPASSWLETAGASLTDALQRDGLDGVAPFEPREFEQPFPSIMLVLEPQARSLIGYVKITARLLTAVPDISAEDARTLVQIFVEKYYLRVAGLPANTSRAAALWHFLTIGLWRELSPSPLFCEEDYDASCRARMIQRPGIFKPWLLHWLCTGNRLDVVPTKWFDSTFYRLTYPAHAAAPFLDFVVSGIWVGRAPNLLFSSAWYSGHNIVPVDETAPPFLNFLMGEEDGRGSPGPFVSMLTFRLPEPVPLPSIRNAVERIVELQQTFSLGEVDLALAMFVSPDLAEVGREWDAFIAFIGAIREDREITSLLFDPDHYRQSAAAAGFTVRDQVSAFGHFLRIGAAAKIVPTPLFDAHFYGTTYTDVQDDWMWLFEHFIRYGIFEGRQPSRMPRLIVAAKSEAVTMSARAQARATFLEGLVWAPLGRHYTKEALPPGARAGALLASPLFRDVVATAREMEPEIGSLEGALLLMPPIHDPAAGKAATLRDRLSGADYGTIVCVPWLRMGGADLVACLVADAIAHLFPNQRVLLLQVDRPEVERADWIPASVDHVDVSDIAETTEPREMERLLYIAMLGVAPTRIINVNSRVIWSMFQRFGARLSGSTDLLGYLFCWDKTSDGLKAGYPSMFYPDTAPHLKRLFTDTQYLRSELIRLYSPPKYLADRIVPLQSPAQSPVWEEPAALAGARSAASRRRPRILWAARLDRQKRFDLVIALARLMPHADFVCWGSAVMDAPPDLANLPPNLEVNPPFRGYEELPLREADVWLFTAEWEGLPTILIELGARGMPIVASAVGGVPELITASTGWPIYEIDDPAAYRAALEEAIRHPEERVKRGRELSALVRRRYSNEAYRASLRRQLVQQDGQ